MKEFKSSEAKGGGAKEASSFPEKSDNSAASKDVADIPKKTTALSFGQSLQQGLAIKKAKAEKEKAKAIAASKIPQPPKICVICKVACNTTCSVCKEVFYCSKVRYMNI